MGAMRQTWTDERLDEGFARVSADIRSARQETAALRQEMNGRFERMEGRFEHLESRFDGVQRTLLQVGGGIVVALIGVIATQL